MEYILLIWLLGAIIVAFQRRLQDLEDYYERTKKEDYYDRYYDDINIEFEASTIIL